MSHGPFMVEGVIDLNGGKLILTPSKWVLQTPGNSWFGLAGDSDDAARRSVGI
jgi:hypothetical protein